MKISLSVKRIIIAFIDICCVAGGVFLRHFIPTLMGTLPGCNFVKMGLPCPACGGTRCVLNVLHFNFITAFKYNPFVFCLGAYMGITLIVWNVAWFTGQEKWNKAFRKLANTNAIIVWGVLFFAFWGYRWLTM